MLPTPSRIETMVDEGCVVAVLAADVPGVVALIAAADGAAVEVVVPVVRLTAVRVAVESGGA